MKITIIKYREKFIMAPVRLLIMAVFLFISLTTYSQQNDWRNIENAISIIPDESYCDQPYSVVNKKNDWIEDEGNYYFTETQKTIARVHHIPDDFLEMLWNQGEKPERTTDGLILKLTGQSCSPGMEFTMPDLGKLSGGEGFSLEIYVQPLNLNKTRTLIDTRRKENKGYGSSAQYAGNGLSVKILRSGALEFLMDDGRSPLLWSSANGLIENKKVNHIVINVDAKSKLVSFVINGELWDGGERPFGYARFNPYMYDVNGEKTVSFSKNFTGCIPAFRIFNRSLFTSEAINNYLTGKGVL